MTEGAPTNSAFNRPSIAKLIRRRATIESLSSSRHSLAGSFSRRRSSGESSAATVTVSNDLERLDKYKTQSSDTSAGVSVAEPSTKKRRISERDQKTEEEHGAMRGQSNQDSDIEAGLGIGRRRRRSSTTLSSGESIDDLSRPPPVIGRPDRGFSDGSSNVEENGLNAEGNTAGEDAGETTRRDRREQGEGGEGAGSISGSRLSGLSLDSRLSRLSSVSSSNTEREGTRATVGAHNSSAGDVSAAERLKYRGGRREAGHATIAEDTGPAEGEPDEDEYVVGQVMMAEVRRTSRVLRERELNQVDYSSFIDTDDEENMDNAVRRAWTAGESARRDYYDRRRTTNHSSTSTMEAGRRPLTIRAVPVDDEPVEAIRVSNSQLDPGDEPKEDDDLEWRRIARNRLLLSFALIALVSVAAVIGLAAGMARNNSDSPSDPEDSARGVPLSPPPPTFEPTLTQVKREGVLRCGVPPKKHGFSGFDPSTGERKGMSIDLCKAVAKAVLRSNSRVEFVEVTSMTRFVALANGEIDLLLWGDTHTMEREFHEKATEVGFQFSDPYFYDGLSFAGIPHAVQCADTYDWVEDCSDLRICVVSQTTHQDILSPIFPRMTIIPKDSQTSMLQAFVDGECSVIAGEQPDIAQTSVRDTGYDGEYVYGNQLLSKEPLAMVTRKDDQRWSDVVNWVLRTLIHAERNGVTQSNANAILQGCPFSSVLEEVGNYGEIYARSMEEVVPRKGLNLLYTAGDEKASGLHYSHPYGVIDGASKHQFSPNGTINRVIDRRRLKCGISVGNGRPIDYDFCRALAASLFDSDSSLIDFIEVSDEDSIKKKLDRGEVDVVAGANNDFLDDMMPSNGTLSGVSGLSFSPPYYYEEDGAVRATLATGQDDSDWSSYVFWIVTATIWAEENGVSSNDYRSAPMVSLFGPRFEWMIRGCVARGNYAEIYDRNADTLPPRADYNLINNLSSPQLYPPQIEKTLGSQGCVLSTGDSSKRPNSGSLRRLL